MSNASERPIIFICHGFGGILVKRALVYSSTSRSKKVEHRRSIYISTYAILFLGTPHDGMSKDAVLLPADNSEAGPSQFMLSLLKRSEMLREITDQFAPHMGRFSIYYFWEQTVTHVGNSKAFIVDEESAAPAWDNVDRCGILATHSGMVKFKSREDHGYRVVASALGRYIKAAPGLIKFRWANDRKLLAEERQTEAEELLRSQPSRRSTYDEAGPTDFNELYLVPRCSTNYFTGRKLHAKDLKDKFGPIEQKIKGRDLKVFVILGLGGSGKTQFCLKYVEDNRARYIVPPPAPKPDVSADCLFVLDTGEYSG
jgi:hypothetical protein